MGQLVGGQGESIVYAGLIGACGLPRGRAVVSPCTPALPTPFFSYQQVVRISPAPGFLSRKSPGLARPNPGGRPRAFRYPVLAVPGGHRFQKQVFAHRCRRVSNQSFLKKTSPLEKPSKAEAGLPKLTAKTSEGCPASHWERSTVW